MPLESAGAHARAIRSTLVRIPRDAGASGIDGRDVERDRSRLETCPRRPSRDRVLSRARDGGIICLHDGRGTLKDPDVRPTIEAVRRIVPALLEKGYHFETVSQLLCPRLMQSDELTRVYCGSSPKPAQRPVPSHHRQQLRRAGHRLHGRRQHRFRARKRVRHQCAGRGSEEPSAPCGTWWKECAS